MAAPLPHRAALTAVVAARAAVLEVGGEEGVGKSSACGVVRNDSVWLALAPLRHTARSGFAFGEEGCYLYSLARLNKHGASPRLS